MGEDALILIGFVAVLVGSLVWALRFNRANPSRGGNSDLFYVPTYPTVGDTTSTAHTHSHTDCHGSTTDHCSHDIGVSHDVGGVNDFGDGGGGHH